LNSIVLLAIDDWLRALLRSSGTGAVTVAVWEGFTRDAMHKDGKRRDMGTKEGMEEADKKGYFTTRCPGYVKTAGEILEKMLA